MMTSRCETTVPAQVQFCGLRPTIDGCDLDQYLFPRAFGIFDKNIEIAVAVKDSGDVINWVLYSRTICASCREPPGREVVTYAMDKSAPSLK